MKKSDVLELKKAAGDFFTQDKKRVYAPSEIKTIMVEFKKTLKLPKRSTTDQMIHALNTSNKLKLIELSFPAKTYKRYTWGKRSIYEILLSIDPAAYYSHLSALNFHKLSGQNSSDIYLNVEQAKKPKYNNRLEQQNITKAFSRKQRVTKNTTYYQQNQIYLLNGMNTDKMGIIKMRGPKKEDIYVTNIERTLIDIAVRPYYSGGVSNVLNAYRKVIGKVNISNLVDMLKKLDYSYPYHQAIGFYIDKAGFKEASKIFSQKFPMDYDFFLTYQMDGPAYCKKWQIFYPKDLLAT